MPRTRPVSVPARVLVGRSDILRLKDSICCDATWAKVGSYEQYQLKRRGTTTETPENQLKVEDGKSCFKTGVRTREVWTADLSVLARSSDAHVPNRIHADLDTAHRCPHISVFQGRTGAVCVADSG